MSPRRDPVTTLAQLAADLGVSFLPAGHRELLGTITEAARRLFEAQACSIALLTEDGAELEFITAAGAGADAVTEMRIPAGQGIAGWVVMSGQAIAVDDVAADPRFAATVAEATGYVPRSILAMPLETSRRVLGVIEVLDRAEHRAATNRDMELLGVFAAQAALAIESSTVFNSLGRFLLEAWAGASKDEDLAALLRRHASTAPPPRKHMAEIAALFYELGQSSAPERRLAVRVLRELLAYTRDRREGDGE